MRLHVRTARANKSMYDPYTNLLRATTEAISAVIGGADTLLRRAVRLRRASRAQRPAHPREEAHLDAVADPAGGSYYIEALTDALAREAWKLFQQVEAEGGYAAAVRAGLLDQHAAGLARRAREGRRRRAGARSSASTTTPT